MNISPVYPNITFLLTAALAVITASCALQAPSGHWGEAGAWQHWHSSVGPHLLAEIRQSSQSPASTSASGHHKYTAIPDLSFAIRLLDDELDLSPKMDWI